MVGKGEVLKRTPGLVTVENRMLGQINHDADPVGLFSYLAGVQSILKGSKMLPIYGLS